MTRQIYWHYSRDENGCLQLELEIAVWDLKELEKEAGDPFKTLSIDRINYYTSESKHGMVIVHNLAKFT